MTKKTVIADIENHCNNYFNPGNKKESPVRNHPPEFLELADRIREFRNDDINKPSSLFAESIVGVYSWQAGSKNGIPVNWQQVFAGELSPYKRLKLV